MAYNLRDFCGIQCAFGSSTTPTSRWSWRSMPDEIERRFDLARQIDSLPVSMDMHVEDARLVPEEVIMKRGDLQAVIEQCRHDGINFLLGQNEVAHEDVVAAFTFSHCEPPAKAERSWQRNPCDLHMQVVPWDIHSQDIGFVVSGFADDLQNLLVVGGKLLSC